jgi:hypothetical protein
MSIALVVYAALCTFGRAPKLENVKHNQLLGPFLAGYIVWLVGPVERALVGRVSPNLITAVSLAMCGITGLAVGLGGLTAAVWLYTVAGILDILDGRLARLGGKQTAAVLVSGRHAQGLFRLPVCSAGVSGQRPCPTRDTHHSLCGDWSAGRQKPLPNG